MSNKFPLQNIIAIIALLVLAGGGFQMAVVLRRHTTVPPKYVSNTFYEQQKADCLAGKIKCNPVAFTAY